MVSADSRAAVGKMAKPRAQSDARVKSAQPALDTTVVVIHCADPHLRARLDRLLRGAPALKLGSMREESSQQPTDPADVLLAERPTPDQLRQWRARHAATALLALTHNDSDEALAALTSGADGVVLRSAGRRELLAAIEAASRGLTVLPRHLAAKLLDVAAGSTDESNEGENPEHPQLTKREHEVLTAMADGASNKAIARRLHISLSTVKFHVAAVLTKLDADTRTEAVAKAAHLGLIML